LAKLAAPLCGRVRGVGDFTVTSLSGSGYPKPLLMENVPAVTGLVDLLPGGTPCQAFSRMG